jgi:anti-sigma B factor antagonist
VEAIFYEYQHGRNKRTIKRRFRNQRLTAKAQWTIPQTKQGGFIMLNIEKKAVGKHVELALSGRLDTTTAPALETEVKTLLDGAESLVLDFASLEYISSAGLRVLLSAQKIMNRQGVMKLTHVSESVMEIFEVTGFSDILTVE